MKNRNSKGALDDCPVCHGTGWDGEGYTLCCSGCSPSVMDLRVDKTCGRTRDEDGQLMASKKSEPMKDVFGIEIPCAVHNMTDEQVETYLKKVREQTRHDSPYCQDDPGGHLTRVLDKMYELCANLENILLRRENDSLKKELALKTPI